MPEFANSFHQIVTTRSQRSRKDRIFGARKIGHSGLLFLGGNINVKDCNYTVKIGDQGCGLHRLPNGVSPFEMTLVFHFVTANARTWHTLKKNWWPKTLHGKTCAKRWMNSRCCISSA